MDYLLGIDLGGTSIKIGCFDTSLNLIGKAAEATSADMDAATMVGCFRRLAESLLSEHGLGLDDLAAVGIGTPGPIDLNEGIVLAAPNLPLFRNVPLRALVTESLGKKTIMENDANAACWAEYVAGAGQGADEMVMLTLGTGIGGGIITRGRLVHGVAGGAAELGHIILYPEGRLCACGQKGCAEAYASARSTAKRATEAIAEGKSSSMTETLKTNGELTCKDVFDHAAMQDALAKEVIDGTGPGLGTGSVRSWPISSVRNTLCWPAG